MINDNRIRGPPVFYIVFTVDEYMMIDVTIRSKHECITSGARKA